MTGKTITPEANTGLRMTPGGDGDAVRCDGQTDGKTSYNIVAIENGHAAVLVDNRVRWLPLASGTVADPLPVRQEPKIRAMLGNALKSIPAHTVASNGVGGVVDQMLAPFAVKRDE